MTRRHLGLGLLAAVCTACGPDTEPYDITIYGEEFIEDSIPADDMADGWAIKFDTFLIAVTGIDVAGTTVGGSFVFDLTENSGGDGHPITTVDANPEVEAVSYTIEPVSSALAGNVDDAALDMLLSSGGAVHVIGSATKGDVTKTFAWTFDTSTVYSPCEVDAAQRSAELTIHSDHFFYDDFEEPEPELRFDLFAQADDDGDADGVVTAEELQSVDITGLSNYQVGSRDIDNLWEFVVAQSRTLGHINGEGHCETD